MVRFIKTIKDVPHVPGVFQWQVPAGKIGRYDPIVEAYLFDDTKLKHIPWLDKDWVEKNFEEYFVSVRRGREPRSRRRCAGSPPSRPCG